MLVISNQVQIPLAELEITYARSGGPGGQNVNKVNSKAILRWGMRASPALPDGVRQRFLEKFASRLTTEGDLLVTSQRFRDAPRNAQDCLEKLRAMIESVLKPPKPRRPTRPTRGSVQRRLQAKRHRSSAKRQRRAGDEE